MEQQKGTEGHFGITERLRRIGHNIGVALMAIGGYSAPSGMPREGVGEFLPIRREDEPGDGGDASAGRQ